MITVIVMMKVILMKNEYTNKKSNKTTTDVRSYKNNNKRNVKVIGNSHNDYNSNSNN